MTTPGPHPGPGPDPVSLDDVRRRLPPERHLLRRDRDHWQVGLDETVATVVRDPVIDARVRGMLVDRTALPDTDLDDDERAAVVQRAAGEAPRRIAARARTRVHVTGGWGRGCPDPGQLLATSGLATVAQRPDVVLLVFPGEADRDRVDRLVRDDVPHLLLRLVDGVVTVGPFVEPGETACLRCIDAHHALADPAYPALVTQHARLSAAASAGAWAPPRDRALLQLATAWAVRDLVTWAEGDRPTTWSATVRIEAGLAGVTSRQWLRHPECGCRWPPRVDASATMAP